VSGSGSDSKETQRAAASQQSKRHSLRRDTLFSFSSSSLSNSTGVSTPISDPQKELLDLLSGERKQPNGILNLTTRKFADEQWPKLIGKEFGTNEKKKEEIPQERNSPVMRPRNGLIKSNPIRPFPVRNAEDRKQTELQLWENKMETEFETNLKRQKLNAQLNQKWEERKTQWHNEMSSSLVDFEKHFGTWSPPGLGTVEKDKALQELERLKNEFTKKLNEQLETIQKEEQMMGVDLGNNLESWMQEEKNVQMLSEKEQKNLEKASSLLREQLKEEEEVDEEEYFSVEEDED